MKAIVWTQYGSPDVLQLQEVEKPAPGENEILVRVRATTVTTGDCEMRQLKIPLLFRLPMRMFVGIRKPTRVTILGQELAGDVEMAGKQVKLFKEGDPVFGTTGLRLGAYAEYDCLPERAEDSLLAIKPASLSYEQAAAVPLGGLESLRFLRQADLRSGQKVLIYGAGGSIGTIAIQLARHYGAEVTAVDSAAKLEMLRSIGADRVIDYTREDFTRRGETYDVVFDVVGKSSFSRSIRSLRPKGVYLLANPGLSQMLRAGWVSMTGSRKVIYGSSGQRREDLLFLTELIEAGKIKPVVDRLYPLEQVAEAHRYVEQGYKQGNVVISVAGDSQSTRGGSSS